MIGEDDRLVGREERIEFSVGQAVRMIFLGLQRHQIDDVDHPDLQIGKVLAQEAHCRKGLQRRHVAGAGHDHVRFGSLVGAAQSQMPIPAAQCFDRLVHGQPLRGGLFARHDDIDAVPGPQDVVGDPEQRVGVRRQIDANDVGLLVEHDVDEARILVAEAVVVLPPDMARSAGN